MEDADFGLGGHKMTDLLGPGESFEVLLPYRPPRTATLAGAVVHHGVFPDMFIIGADQSLFHRPTLLRLALAMATP